MASTLNFRQTLQTGFSFLKVSLVIFIFSSSIGAIGLSGIRRTQEYGDPSGLYIGILFLFISLFILVAGIIGLVQKLISDAFLDGFNSAKEDGNVGDGTRMNTMQTLENGFRVLGIVMLTLIITGVLFAIGFYRYIDGYGGTFFFASGCAIFLAMVFGLLTRIIAEGVSFGATSTGVSFESSPTKLSSSQDFSDSKSISELFPADMSPSKKLLLMSSVILFIGYILPWWSGPEWFSDWGFSMSHNGLEFLPALGGLIELNFDAWGTASLLNNLEDLVDGSHPSNRLFTFKEIIFLLMPWLFIATFSYAWVGINRADENMVNVAGWIHVNFFLLFILTSLVAEIIWLSSFGISVVIEHDWSHFISDQFLNRSGINIAGFAGLGLIRYPWNFLSFFGEENASSTNNLPLEEIEKMEVDEELSSENE